MTIQQSFSPHATAHSAVRTERPGMKQGTLNGFEIGFSKPTFTAAVRKLTGSDCVRSIRKEVGDSAFVYSRGTEVYILPRNPETWNSADPLIELQCHEHLQLLASCIAAILPEKFPAYEILRRRPFSIAGRKGEVVAAISTKLGSGVPPLINEFKIKPKFEFEARVVEPIPGESRVCLFVKFNTRWEVHAQISDLLSFGVDLGGLHVKYRQPDGGRSLVGRVKTARADFIELSESYVDGVSSVPAADVMLEGSKQVFSRCLKQVLGPRMYERFEDERTREEAKRFTGKAIDELLKKVHKYLTDAAEMELYGGLSCSVGGQLLLGNSPEYQTITSSSPVDYCFDAARTKRYQYAWPGIEKFGPFSRDTFARKSPLIWVIFPDTIQGQVENFLRQFRDGIPGTKFAGGFGKLFCLTNPQFKLVPIPWLENRQKQPVEVYQKTIEQHLTNSDGTTPDTALVFVLDEHARFPDASNPYLHSKALLLMAGVPVQEIRSKTAAQPQNALPYIFQNIAIALYAKMNGIPWTVDNDVTINDELVIGLGNCELSGSRFDERKRFVGITTVFRGDGNYLLGNFSKECSFAEYPEMLRNSVVAILKDVKARNGWQKGDTVRLVFHSFKPLKNIEIADIIKDAVQEVGEEQNIEFAFLTVSFDHPFLILDKNQMGISGRTGGRKAVFVPERGTILEIGRFTRLLCTNGPFLIKRENSPHPAPVLVHLHRQSTFKDLQYLSEQVLKFTSLSWRSTLPARKPVTIYYSELIAELLARLRGVRDWSPAMLNSKLRPSRWFL